MFFTIKQKLYELIRVGVTQRPDGEVSRVLFTNVVFICLPVVYLAFIIIDYKSYQVPIDELNFDQFVVPFIIIFCFLGLWLNYLKFTTLSRALFLTLWPLLLHIIPIRILEAPSDYYLAFPFGIVFHSILIQLLFSYRHETALFCSFLIVNLLGMIWAPEILNFFNTNQEIPVEMLEDRYFLLDGILYWLLFNLVTFYILYVTELAIGRLHLSKKLIEDQKEELNILNQTLEAQVIKRTAEVMQKNKKLNSHAYYNAHLLRGPFCRILGLMPLLANAEEGSEEKAQIQEMLDRSLSELDARIMEIQDLLDIDSVEEH
jgi:hypothetical protein